MTAAVVTLVVLPADAHGSTQRPASRTYTCRFENPDNPMCAQAWSANSQALYDWMEVNIGDAAGRHQELIPDGQLCGAGRDKYAAFNRPGDWPVTNLTADGSGLFELVYQNTAPHSTEYYRVYITGAGFDARTDTLGWGDLELVYDSGQLPRATENRFQVALPNRDVPAIVYVVWQRSDSPEAFYACSDVTVSGGSGAPAPPPDTTPGTTAPPATTPTTAPADPGTPTTVAPPTTAPADPAAPTTTAPAAPSTTAPVDPGMTVPDEGMVSVVAGMDATRTVTAKWDSGQCFVVTVTNTNDSAFGWEVHLDPGGRVDALWNATSATMGQGEEAHLRLTGEEWNGRIGAGQSTNFGMCVGY